MMCKILLTWKLVMIAYCSHEPSRIMGYLLSCVQSPVNIKTDDGQFLADIYQVKQ